LKDEAHFERRQIMRGFLIALAAAAAFAAASAKAATSTPMQQSAAADTPDTSTDANPTGDYRKTWKVGPNGYGFEGISGGCHYSGTVSPSGYHLDRSC
jgi:hypothetical protein